MRFRKLRITWTVFCGIACVLLICLWVRSYWKSDSLVWKVNDNLMVNVSPHRGRVTVSGVEGSKEMRLQSVSRFHISTLPINMISSSPQWNISRQSQPTAAVIITVPLWSVILLTTTIAAAPCLRLNLRTLLFATTLVAVVLGLVVYAVRK